MLSQRMGISKSIAFRRLFVTAASRPLRAAPANGGFGEEERQKKGNEGTKDSAPYQNEVTKSGTNSEVAHNDDSYAADNTDPTRSNEKQGEALDASPANTAASRSADAGNSSNKSGRNQTSSSGFNSASGSQGNRSGSKDVGRDDTSTAKFDKLSKENEDVQNVGGRKVTN